MHICSRTEDLILRHLALSPAPKNHRGQSVAIYGTNSTADEVVRFAEFCDAPNESKTKELLRRFKKLHLAARSVAMELRLHKRLKLFAVDSIEREHLSKKVYSILFRNVKQKWDRALQKL